MKNVQKVFAMVLVETNKQMMDQKVNCDRLLQVEEDKLKELESSLEDVRMSLDVNQQLAQQSLLEQQITDLEGEKHALFTNLGNLDDQIAHIKEKEHYPVKIKALNMKIRRMKKMLLLQSEQIGTNGVLNRQKKKEYIMLLKRLSEN